MEPQEIECTALMEQVLKSAENVYVLETVKDRQFCALFYLRNCSTIFHYIPILEKLNSIEDESSKDQLKKIKFHLWNFLRDQRIFCIYGEKQGTDFISQILIENKKELIVSIDYLLMKNDFSSEIFKKEIEQRTDLFVRKCSTDDTEFLLELEKGYRKEEVSITDGNESDKVVRMILSKNLAGQNVFGAFRINNGRIEALAKAATNACGKNFYQIGGVYCRKEFRNKRIMFYVMLHLLKFIQNENKTANLFVKVKNEPAKKLYENLGFKVAGNYEISYFHKQE